MHPEVDLCHSMLVTQSGLVERTTEAQKNAELLVRGQTFISYISVFSWGPLSINTFECFDNIQSQRAKLLHLQVKL